MCGACLWASLVWIVGSLVQFIRRPMYKIRYYMMQQTKNRQEALWHDWLILTHWLKQMTLKLKWIMQNGSGVGWIDWRHGSDRSHNWYSDAWSGVCTDAIALTFVSPKPSKLTEIRSSLCGGGGWRRSQGVYFTEPLIAKNDRTSSKHETMTQCWVNVGPAS